jgi:hypothetical protein
MRLVTFQKDDGNLRAGALIDGDARVVDLAEAHAAAFGRDGAASVLTLVEGGDDALDQVYEAVRRAPASAILARAESAPSRADSTAPADAGLPVLRAAPQAGLRRLTQACGHAGTGPGKGNRGDRAQRGAGRASDILQTADLLQGEPLCGDRDRRGRDLARLFQVPRFRARVRGLHQGQGHGRAQSRRSEARLRYTIFNDVSVRDAQAVEMEGRRGPAKGKDFDTGNAMGPCLVRADEIPNPYNLTMIARVNGEEWGRGNSGSMYWKFEDLISYISRSETLYPGEFLGLGTVGNGCGLEHMRFIKPGDVIELEVERIGVLRNRVVSS